MRKIGMVSPDPYWFSTASYDFRSLYLLLVCDFHPRLKDKLTVRWLRILLRASCLRSFNCMELLHFCFYPAFSLAFTLGRMCAKHVFTMAFFYVQLGTNLSSGPVRSLRARRRQRLARYIMDMFIFSIYIWYSVFNLFIYEYGNFQQFILLIRLSIFYTEFCWWPN